MPAAGAVIAVSRAALSAYTPGFKTGAENTPLTSSSANLEFSGSLPFTTNNCSFPVPKFDIRSPLSTTTVRTIA